MFWRPLDFEGFLYICTMLLLNALFIIGLHFAFSAGNVFYFIHERYINKAVISKYANILLPLKKPLFGCAPCMSSMWGFFFWDTSYAWYLYPVWVGCLAGLIVIINGLINR